MQGLTVTLSPIELFGVGLIVLVLGAIALALYKAK